MDHVWTWNRHMPLRWLLVDEYTSSADVAMGSAPTSTGCSSHPSRCRNRSATRCSAATRPVPCVRRWTPRRRLTADPVTPNARRGFRPSRSIRCTIRSGHRRAVVSATTSAAPARRSCSTWKCSATGPLQRGTAWWTSSCGGACGSCRRCTGRPRGLRTRRASFSTAGPRSRWARAAAPPGSSTTVHIRRSSR